MIAGSDTSNGAASSLTDRSGTSASRITSARRVGSDSAAKVRSSGELETLTMWLSIGGSAAVSTGIHPFLNIGPSNHPTMDTTSLITAVMGAQTGMLQLAVAASLARMNAENSSSVAQLIDAAQHGANSLANVAATIGTNLDVSA